MRPAAAGIPVDERAAGETLTSYVLRGSDDPAYRFVP